MSKVKLIRADELWTCKTCFYNSSRGCSVWCDAGEGYRPAYDKLTKYEIAEEDLANAKTSNG